MAIREENSRENERIIAGSAFPREVLTLEGMVRLADSLSSGSDADIAARWWVFKRKDKDGSETTFMGGGKD